MEQTTFEDIPKSLKFDALSKEALIQKYSVLESELHRVLKENYELRQLKITDEQLRLLTEEQLLELVAKTFGASSEKYKKPDKPTKEPVPPKPRIKRPSERYPNLPVREVVITMSPIPSCSCCGDGMSDSGMREVSEQLTVIPKRYEIVEQQRVIYRCSGCHGDLQTASAPARIMEGSSYSDDMIIDVSLSKYCDLIPVERYVAIAARSGVRDIPPQSLIECTHYLADFLIEVYLKLKGGILAADILAADETPHKMLEGSDKKSWYLWGFSTENFCYFECHDTRSADVASEILKYANCRILLTDVYTGYGKATRDANVVRNQLGRPEIKNAYCNAHARRYFFKAMKIYPESIFYMDQYVEIYKLNAEARGKSPDEVLELRQKMRPYFEAMKEQGQKDLLTTPEQGKHAKGVRYFLGNYQGLTLCLENGQVSLDNNAQERMLRSPVVGRKTWYGTHSERGARTAAILFSVSESCKLNGVNPRDYTPFVIEAIQQRKPVLTPHEYALLGKGNASMPEAPG
jgi:transposase